MRRQIRGGGKEKRGERRETINLSQKRERKDRELRGKKKKNR